MRRRVRSWTGGSKQEVIVRVRGEAASPERVRWPGACEQRVFLEPREEAVLSLQSEPPSRQDFASVVSLPSCRRETTVRLRDLAAIAHADYRWRLRPNGARVELPDQTFFEGEETTVSGRWRLLEWRYCPGENTWLLSTPWPALQRTRL
jgi:hypothetical protein